MMTMNIKHPGWQAFVQQMRDRRADLVTRGVFADWCEDTFGEQSFAQFVRAMCDIASTDPDNRLAPGRGWDVPRKPGLHPDWERYHACQRLLTASWMHWPPLSKLPPGIQRQWRFHAGYPDRLVMPFRDWMDNYRTLLAIGPVGSVHVYDNPGCHEYRGVLLVTLVPASRDLVDLCAATKIDHEVFFEVEKWADSRVRFSRGLGMRLVEEQAVEIVMNRVWKPPLVSAIYIDEPRGDSPEEYADR